MTQSEYLANRKKIEKVQTICDDLHYCPLTIDSMIEELESMKQYLIASGVDPDTITVRICNDEPEYPTFDVNWESWETVDQCASRLGIETKLSDEQLEKFKQMFEELTPDNFDKIHNMFEQIKKDRQL